MLKNATQTGLLLIISSLTIIGVSAYVFENSNQSISQTVINIATVNLKSTALGPLREGERKIYNSTTIPDLGDVISITTTTENIYLHLDSDLDSVSGYSAYSIVVKFSEVVGSTYSEGDTACTLTLGSPDYSAIDLDAAGTWAFDFEINTTAGSVSSDTPSTVTINVSAENTS
jgi:hypothetical protein